MGAGSRRRKWGGLTSTQEPQVIPSIRNSHFSVFPRGDPRGSFFRRGSSTLPGEVAEASLYQRPENERADIVARGGIFVVVVVVVVVQEKLQGREKP
jgi:hypothetical protein